MEYYANQNDYRSYLQHFGIQGMKWGVRRYQNPDGSYTPEGKARRRNEEYRAAKKEENRRFKEEDRAIKRSRKEDSRRRRTLSDEELNYKIGRLEKEKKLKELTKEEISPGATAAKREITNVGKKVIKDVGTGVLITVGVAVLSKKIPGLKDYVPKAKKK